MSEDDRDSDRALDGDGSAPEPSKQAKQRKSKKRKPKRRVEPANAADVEPESTLRDALDAQGRERPRFLLNFPDHPQLNQLIAAYERGDYASVRRDAPELAQKSQDPEVREAAVELRRRIEPDPLARYMLLAAITLLVFLLYWTYSHRH
jgi:hypothetical protein